MWVRTLRYNTDISLERHKQSYRWLQHGEDTRGIKAVITQKHAFRVSRKPLLSSKKWLQADCSRCRGERSMSSAGFKHKPDKLSTAGLTIRKEALNFTLSDGHAR